MRQRQRAGRPRAASREILEEAACELFLERGYAATSVADITQRAGVSRATFFNYVPAKSDLLWTSIDDALARLEGELRERAPAGDGADPAAETATALLGLAERLEPGTVVLAFANAEPMGVVQELEDSAALRQRRAAAILAGYLRRCEVDSLVAEVIAAAQAGALLAALRAWSVDSPGSTPFAGVLGRALAALPSA